MQCCCDTYPGAVCHCHLQKIVSSLCGIPVHVRDCCVALHGASEHPVAMGATYAEMS